MADVVKSENVNVRVLTFDDGGVGVTVNDGPVYMGYDADDVCRMLVEVLTDAEKNAKN